MQQQTVSENQNGMQPLHPMPDQEQVWKNYERKPIPFDQAYDQVMGHHKLDGLREDVPIVGLRSWCFTTDDGKTMGLRRLPLPGRRGSDNVHPLRHRAWSQLCGRAGNLPADYLIRLPAKLQMACVNFDLAKANKDALLRLAGGEARALLSSRYAPVDDRDYLAMVADTLAATGYRNDAMVRVVASGPHTVLRVTIPNDRREFKKGDAMEYGIDIGNSELGMRSVQVTPITYRLVCLNGMRAWQSEAAHRMRHVGDPERIRETLQDAIPVAFSEARGDFDLWEKATERLIDDAFAEIESLHSFGFNKLEREQVAKQLVADNDLPGRNLIEQLKGASTNVYEMANAITATARERGTGEEGRVRIEARLNMEEAGHVYLRRRAA